MSDQEDEYEVEYIVRARVERNRGKAWKYLVKWKGYEQEENTWEPKKSFEGSEGIIEQFWLRANTGGRDIGDLSLFKVGEEFFPVGPPRRKSKSKVASEGEATSLVIPSPVTESTLLQKTTTTSGKRRRSTPSPPEVTEHVKQKRRRVSDPSTSSFSKKASPETKSRLHKAKDGDALSARPSRFPKRSSSRQSSSDVPPSETSEIEVTQVYRIDSSKNPSQPGPEAASLPSSRSPSPELSQSDLKSLHEKSQEYMRQRGTLGDQQPSIDIADNETVQAEYVHELFGPSSPDIDQDEKDTPAAPSPALPSHRTRAANPLVKLADIPNLSDMEGAISVKARLLGRNTASSPTSATSSRNLTNGVSPSVRPSGSRPGPGRSSKGLMKKNTSSLLTFEKGQLKTVRGKFKSSATVEKTVDTAQSQDGDRQGDIALDNENNTVLPNGNGNQTSCMALIPSGQELLQLAGLDAQDADTLPDFEDDTPAKEKDKPETPGFAVQSPIEVKDKLFSTPPAFNTLSAVWKPSTIFGPLASGSDVPRAVVTSDSSPFAPFFLTLDSSASIPVFLVDESPSPSGSPGLDSIINKNPTGPPGKFYREQHSLDLLDTLRTRGPSARVITGANISEIEKEHFQRFVTRLDVGELFVAMAGVELLVFCSSGNTFLTQRLNIAPALLGPPGGVLVSRVVIENHSAYADAAIRADSIRW